MPDGDHADRVTLVGGVVIVLGVHTAMTDRVTASAAG
jgi:hypothetical protein